MYIYIYMHENIPGLWNFHITCCWYVCKSNNVSLRLVSWYPIVRIFCFLIEYFAICGGEPVLWDFFFRVVFPSFCFFYVFHFFASFCFYFPVFFNCFLFFIFFSQIHFSLFSTWLDALLNPYLKKKKQHPNNFSRRYLMSGSDTQ